MADMKVSMVLSLLDEASPKLRQFVAALEGLHNMSKTTSDALKVLDESLGGIGATTGDALDGLRMLTQTFGGMNRSTSALTDRLGALEDTLAAVGEKMAAMADSMKLSADSMAAMAASSATVNTGLAAMGTEAEAATGKLQGMHGTMKGLAELWGAWKMGEGLKASVDKAVEYQNTNLMLRMRNLPSSQLALMNQGARSLSAKIPLLNRNDALEAELAAQPGLPGQSQFSKNMRNTLLPGVTRLAVVAKQFGDKASMTHRIQNIFGVIEAMGGAENVARARMIMKDLRGGIIASHGKLDVRSVETALRTLNAGVRTNETSKEFQTQLALQEEMKAAGGGGSGGNTRIATLANNIYMAANKGLMAKGAAVVLETLGLLNPKDVHKYGKSSYYAALNPGALKDAQLASGSPMVWAREKALPAMLKFSEMHWRKFGYKSGSAKDFQNPSEQGRAIAEVAAYLASFRMGGQQFAGGLGLLGNPNVMAAIGSQMHAQTQATKLSATQDLGLTMKTLHGRAQQLDAKLTNLGIQIGTALLPALTKFVHWVATAVNSLTALNHQFPIFKKLEAWAGTLAAVLLGIKGVEWLLGLQHGFLSLKTAMNRLSPAVGGVVDALKAAIAEFGIFDVAAVAAIGAGLGYAIGKIFNMIFHWIGKKLHLPSLGGWLARELHPLKQAHYIAPHGLRHSGFNSQFFVRQFNAQHPLHGAPTGPAEIAGQKAYEAAQKTHVEGGSIIAKMGGSSPTAAQKAAHAAAHAAAVHHAHMAALAQLVYEQYLGISSPTAGKIAAIHAKYQGYQKQFIAHGMLPSYAQAGMVATHDIASLKYHQAMGHLGTLKAHMHNQLTANAALVTAGALTKMQGAQRAIQIQKADAPAMVQAAQAAQRYANALSNPKLVSALQAQIAHLQAMGNQLTYYGARVHQVMQGAFSGLINQMMHGQKTWGQMFISFFQNIANGIDTTISKAIAQSIANGLIKGKKNGQMGGLIGSAMSWLSGAFGVGASSGGSAPHGASTTQAAGKVASALGHAMKSSKSGSGSGSSSMGFWGEVASLAGSVLSSFAVGTTAVPHDMVAQIHKGEMIIPAGPAGQIRAGAGGASGSTVHMHINTIDSTSFLGHMAKVKREVANMVSSTQNQYNMAHG